MSRGMRRPPRRPAARPSGWVRTLALVAATWAAFPAGPLAAQTMDDHVYTYLAFDELEYAHGFGERPVVHDAQAWIGGDYDRLWLKARGEHATVAAAGAVEAEALYSRTATAFWNLQGGVRLDHAYGDGDGATRGLLAFGVTGLAPYWLEVEAFGYVSHEGDVSARVEAAYELLFTQRLVLEPEVEVGLAVQEVPGWGVASGLDALEFGVRLRYELRREFAPYVGWVWERNDVPGGDAHSEGSFVAGLRWWY